MLDFRKYLNKCNENSAMTDKVIDEFLIYYAEHKNKVGTHFDKKIKKYRHISQKMPNEWIGLLKAQIIAHAIFKEKGLIHKYVHHSDIKDLPKNEISFLKEQAQEPWLFCFSRIIGRPEKDFYRIEDLFSQKEYLVYSQGMTKTLKEREISIWFTLMAFNGACWQTFGPIASFNGMTPDDIFFFATEVDENIESEADISPGIQKNPLPYTQLISSSLRPAVYHKNQLTVQNLSIDDELPAPDPKMLEPDFDIEIKNEVLAIKAKDYDAFPYFAIAYYDHKKGVLLRSAMNDKGFDLLTARLNKHGYELSPFADIRVTPNMLDTTESILKKELILNPYEKLFIAEATPEERQRTEDLNHLMELMLPYINRQEMPDVEALAKETHIDAEEIKALAEQLLQKFGQR